MRISAQRLALLLLICGCGDEAWQQPPAISQEQFAREFQEWRAWRHSRLIAPGGPLTLIGLWELQPDSMAAGADSTLPIVLPKSHSPRLAGTFHRSGAEVRFEPAPGAGVRLAEGKAVEAPLLLASDRTDSTTTLAIGSLRLLVHGEPGTDRLWLRAWDEQHPARATFRLPESYPLDMNWRVSARFDSFKTPRHFRVPDITQGTQAYRSPGELVFRAGGREHRFVGFAEEDERNFFIIFWDSTARTTTYQAGRYMRVPFPDSTGWTVIDFNRAYNPPCVFSEYSTCAFAPPENRLQLAVHAGEKRVR